MAMLPDFTADGVFPPGDYELTFKELRASPLVIGSLLAPATWDATWRGQLLANAEILVGQLWSVGIREIYLDGSFVENRDHPGDIDGYFECDLMFLASGELQRRLNLLDPYKVWTWDPRSRRPHRGKLQLPMWHRYRVELFPHVGQLTGILDEFGNELEFPAAFRKSRLFIPKGIVKIGGAP